MNSLRRIARHPSRTLEDINDEIAHYGHAMARRPYATGGLIMLVLGFICFIWLFPELRRYLRMERM